MERTGLPLKPVRRCQEWCHRGNLDKEKEDVEEFTPGSLGLFCEEGGTVIG